MTGLVSRLPAYVLLLVSVLVLSASHESFAEAKKISGTARAVAILADHEARR